VVYASGVAMATKQLTPADLAAIEIRRTHSAGQMALDGTLPEACDSGDRWGGWMSALPPEELCAICDCEHEGMLVA
jgi:hypothetical protein